MPRFVDEPLGVVTWIRHFETVFLGMQTQPSERAGIGEDFFERRTFIGADINCAPSMMLTEAGCGNRMEDFGNFFANSEFAADNLDLTFDAAEAGEWLEFDIELTSTGVHAVPGPSGRADQSAGFPFWAIAYGNQIGCCGLNLKRELSGLGVIGGNTEFAK